MTKVFIFTGPTLRPEEARAELDAVYLPPVQQGDVYRAAREGPVAIGIIDGFFEHVPAVWHKEILWAMSEGIHVFGASSMGALRATELAAFGMEGVGDIFDAFHRGELEDDDDVAVAHAGAEDGWRPLSEAMVNVSATLSAAWLERVVSEGTRMALEQKAKALFYVDRTWPRVLAEGARAGLPASELEALKAWLPSGRVDVKRADALALLRTMR
ncbi:TfuA-like protein, partial [Pyxidicoccus sp. 3LG]